jgi:peptide/nickel transport system substrate-binding protein
MRTKSNRIGRVLALIAVLALVMAACSSSSDGDSTTTTAGSGGEATTTTAGGSEATTTTAGASETTTTAGEAVGGVLKVGILNDITAWDSSRLQGTMFPIHRNLYDTLADYENGLNAMPRLATGWVISDAQDSVTITLRDDVVFDSGRTMTADDVAANLAIFIDPETGNQVYGPTSGVVMDWEVTSPTEIVVNFQRPTNELQITDLLTSWAIGDPEFFDMYPTEAHGTGPFSFAEWIPGQSITMIANTAYWGDGPYIDGIEYRIFGDSDSMAAAMEGGDIDVMYSPTAAQAKRLEGLGFTNVVGPAGAIIDQFRIEASQPPWDNANLRLALSYAMDMPTINEAIYEGLGTVVRLPYAPTSPAFDQDLAATMAYDMDKAKALLDSSGLPESEWVGVVMTRSNDDAAILVSQIVQASMAELGFDLQIDLADPATTSDRYFSSDFEVYWSGIGNAQKYPTRISTNSIYRTTGNAIFDMEGLFPDYVAAVDQANAAVTSEEAEVAFDALNKSLTEGMWAVSGIARPMLTSTAAYVSGVFKDIDAQDHYQLVRISK